MNKVLDVHSQCFLRERIRIRSRTQSAPAAILNDGTGGVADDRVAASLQRQQERGLPCAGAACDHYSRHAEDAPDYRLVRRFMPTLNSASTHCPLTRITSVPTGVFLLPAVDSGIRGRCPKDTAPDIV